MYSTLCTSTVYSVTTGTEATGNTVFLNEEASLESIYVNAL